MTYFDHGTSTRVRAREQSVTVPHPFTGGEPIKKHRQQLKEGLPHIVVATPGRLKALVAEKSLALHGVKYFVVDECDCVLESLGTPTALLLPTQPYSLWSPQMQCGLSKACTSCQLASSSTIATPIPVDIEAAILTQHLLVGPQTCARTCRLCSKVRLGRSRW